MLSSAQPNKVPSPLVNRRQLTQQRRSSAELTHHVEPQTNSPPSLGSVLASKRKKKKNQVVTLMSSNGSNLSKLEEYQRIPVAELELIEEVESIGSRVEESKSSLNDNSDEDEEESNYDKNLFYKRCLESDEHPATKKKSSMKLKHVQRRESKSTQQLNKFSNVFGQKSFDNQQKLINRKFSHDRPRFKNYNLNQ